MTQQYTEEISRLHPATIIFLIDQSGSMADPFGGKGASIKAGFVVDALNRLIDEILLKVTKGDEVRDYFQLAAIGYGNVVESAFGGALVGKDKLKISDLANNILETQMRKRKVPDGAGGVIEVEEPFPIWLTAKADGVTPMKQAFEKARTIVEESLKGDPQCFPPVIINITDGAYTPPGAQGDPASVVQEIVSLQNANGASPLVFNCHITHEQGSSVPYPVSDTEVRDEYAKKLWAMSSDLPESFVAEGIARKIEGIRNGSKGFVYNADPVSLIEFLNIGTKITEVKPGSTLQGSEIQPGREAIPGQSGSEVPGGIEIIPPESFQDNK
jgi:hypothetical protein